MEGKLEREVGWMANETGNCKKEEKWEGKWNCKKEEKWEGKWNWKKEEKWEGKWNWKRCLVSVCYDMLFDFV